MNKETLLSPILISLLAIAFVIVVFLVFFFPNNSKLINRKIKIGAAILTLTAFVNTSTYAQKTCYKRAEPIEKITIKGQKDYGIINILDSDTMITGKIENLMSTQYYYSVSNKNDEVFLTGKLEAKDGKMDEENENFTLKLIKMYQGEYKLKIYKSEEAMKNSYHFFNAVLKVAFDKKQPQILCYY